MQASRNPRGGRTAPVAVLLACAALAATPLGPAAAQTYAQKTAAAVDYILVHSERESMMLVDARWGASLSDHAFSDGPAASEPADRPDLHPVSHRRDHPRGLFSGFIRSFIENGYAVMIENVRGRYFSEGTYTYLVGSGNDGYDTIEWISKTDLVQRQGRRDRLLIERRRAAQDERGAASRPRRGGADGLRRRHREGRAV